MKKTDCRAALMGCLLIVFLFLSFSVNISSYAQSADAPKPVPRDIIALYDGKGQYGHDLRRNMLHRVYEMPLNYLGYNVRYHDVHLGELPKLGERVHGVIIYFDEAIEFDRKSYVKWLADGVDRGKKVVLIGDVGIPDLSILDDESRSLLKKVHAAAGVRHMSSWHLLTQNTKLDYISPEIMNFERGISAPFPPYERMLKAAKGTSYLSVIIDDRYPKKKADLVVSGPGGGYISPEYDYHEQDINGRFITSWYLNPFTFLREALGAMHMPKPDITTHLGKRIFYSHVDGDGWNNLARIERYNSAVVAASDIISEEIFKKYPNFGFSVGLVVGDLVDKCFGSEKSREVARKILELTNIEPASHTYTHPLYWQFFENYDAETEATYASSFPKRPGLFAQSMKTILGAHNHPKNSARIQRLRTRKDHDNDLEFEVLTPEEDMLQVYDVPRSYDCVEYDEDLEITGAIDVINSLAPAHKKVKLIQWSGNTSPYPRFLKKVREAKIWNINGGESRFDPEYPSYSTIYPIGVQVGGERQIYSTASNENTYTNLWSERFFGYRYLIETVQRTNVPRRIAPFNVYFHSYSGERPASLRALQEIMQYASGQDVIPMYSSQFAAIANGFYGVKFDEIGDLAWRVKDRGALQTIRFDDMEGYHVDHDASKGVLGYRSEEGRIYVSLNPSVPEPEIVLTKQPAPALSLISSRLNVIAAKRESADSITMKMTGFSEGMVHFRVPEAGDYAVSYQSEGANAKRKGAKVSVLEGEDLVYHLTDVDHESPIVFHLQKY